MEVRDFTYMSICLMQTMALYHYMLSLVLETKYEDIRVYRITSKVRNRFFRIQAEIRTQFGIVLYRNGLVF